MKDIEATAATCDYLKIFIAQMRLSSKLGLLHLRSFAHLIYIYIYISEMIRKKTTIVFNLQNMFRIFLYPSSVAIISNC